jgi:hypothetical protein
VVVQTGGMPKRTQISWLLDDGTGGTWFSWLQGNRITLPTLPVDSSWGLQVRLKTATNAAGLWVELPRPTIAWLELDAAGNPSFR